MALEIKDSNYEAIVAEGKPVVLDFWATWCGPCKQIAPFIEELAEEFKDTVNIGKCDVDDNCLLSLASVTSLLYCSSRTVRWSTNR